MADRQESSMMWQKREEALREQRASNWTKAAELWREAGEPSHAEACEAIKEACDKGDRFRERVTQLMEDATLKAYAQANKEIYGG